MLEIICFRVFREGDLFSRSNRWLAIPRDTWLRMRAKASTILRGVPVHETWLSPKHAEDRDQWMERRQVRRGRAWPRIVRSTFRYPGFRTAAKKCVGINDSLKVDSACANRTRESADGFGAASAEADVAELRGGENVRGGKKWVRRRASRNGLPKALTKRPARVVAPFTVTCWPRIARVASSKPFQQPGTRRPGSASMLAANAGSPLRLCAMAAQSAFRSNMARMRSTIKKSECGSPNSMRTRSTERGSSRETSK